MKNKVKSQLHTRVYIWVFNHYFYRYYFCTEKGAQGILKECGGDKAFNIADGSCTAKVGELGACKNIEADCETQTAGFSAPFTQNKKFYYICKAKTENDKRILFPEVYKCEDGLEYTAEEGCKKNWFE